MNVWQLIKESKHNNNYTPSRLQFNNLIRLLKTLDKNEVKKLQQEWDAVHKELTNKEEREFLKLHWNRGGIIESGDDQLFLDFGNWVIAQGEELFNKFKENGHAAILDYINKNDVNESDYMFESMYYCFFKVLD